MYAQINRETNLMIGVPKEVPQRWITPDGVTISSFNKLSKVILQAFDWLPVIYEELMDGATHNLQSVYDKINQQFIFEAIPQDTNILIKQSERRIDEAASFTCEKYISQGVGQDARYLMKYIQAVDYLVDVSSNIEKYLMIKREAELSGMSYLDMANLIIKTANEWINIAAEIEAIRCSTKMKIRKAKDNAEIIRLRNKAIADLETS